MTIEMASENLRFQVHGNDCSAQELLHGPATKPSHGYALQNCVDRNILHRGGVDCVLVY